MDHLAIPVSDQERSRRFYEAYFGFGARPARRYDDGVLMLYDAKGFALALGLAEERIAPPTWMHFGVGMRDREAVRALRDRLAADGVELVEEWDEPDYASVKCRDPAGYIVEAHGSLSGEDRCPEGSLRCPSAMIFRCPGRHTNMTSTTQDPDTQLDRRSFTISVQRYRRELHVHCYRMLGSFEESEDLVQETFLRAWRRRQTFEGRSSLRAWLYRIATNACLDALDKRPRTVSATGEVLWLQPYPDELLEELVGAGEDPEATVVSKETIELAYLVAIQRLVPLQRAVLILRDVLGLSAKETASVLETSVPAVNSALQRARAAMGDHLPERREEWPSGTDVTAAERELLDRYVEYSEGPDPIALKRLLSEDVRFSMPPQPGLWEGREEVVQSWIDGGFGSEAFGSLRCLVTRANRQPAVANYVRKPGDEGYTPMALDVVRIVDGEVADIVTFDGSVFPWFGLPESL